MPFSSIDAPGVLRALSQVAERDDDLADVYFERREEIALPTVDAAGPGLQVWREEGLAVRLLREGRTWLAGRDGIGPDELGDALRRVARAMPRAAYPRPAVSATRWREPPAAPELVELAPHVRRHLAEREVPGDVRWTLRRHQRWVKVIGNAVTSATEHERFYSVVASTPWGRWGSLTTALDEAFATAAADALEQQWRARDAEPSGATWTGPCVLGPSAAAVLLHEAVAHALEADHLARGGDPEAAIGLRMGSELLDVFDDPGAAPASVRRGADDEGFPTRKRHLLRAGTVTEPLADATWARRLDALSAGAGRRGDRHHPPGPRSHHLVLIPGADDDDGLFAAADGGLYFPDVARGRLEPLSGELTLRFDVGFRIEDGAPGRPFGPCALRGHVAEILGAVSAVGAATRPAGAGWCAKDGAKLPVWATAAPLLLEQQTVVP
ncbi:MAG: TldD/PmbA family protein [Acidobacteriota bacterium]